MAEDSPLSPDGNLTEYEYETLIGATSPSGLIGHPDDPSPVSLVGGQVIVAAGLRGRLRGMPWLSGVDPVPFSPSLTGSTRTDLVVLRLDRADGHKVKAAIRTGTAGNPAPAPFGGTGPSDWWEIPIAEYDVGGGSFGSLRRRCWYVGPEGQLLCKSSTRPPHSPGRIITEVDTGTRFVSNGVSWMRDTEDASGPFDTVNGVSGNNAWIRRRNGQVFFTLSWWRPNSSTPAHSTVTIGRLPVGFYPAFTFVTGAVSPGANAVLAVVIQDDGYVKMQTGSVPIGADTTCILTAPPFPAK